MMITDTMTLDASGLTMTGDGYLIGDAKVSRAGNVQQYRGDELGLTGDSAGQMFGVYRDPDVVFDDKSMLSLAGRPVTRGHPDGGVTSANWHDLAKGQMGGTIRRDGEHVVAPMAIMDASAAKEVEDGARSLSAGYTCGIIADEGVSPGGEPFQFRQAGPLRFNHVAYLPDNNPRAGNTRIGDDADHSGDHPPANPPKEDIMSDALISVVLGDKAVNVPAAQAPAIEAFKADSAKALLDMETSHAAAIAAKDAEIAKIEAAKDAAVAKVPTAEQRHKDAAILGKLIADAKLIAPDVKTDGLTDAAIRKAVVVAKLGADMADKSDAYLDARFDILCEDASVQTDTFAQGVKTGIKPQLNDAQAEQAAHAAMIADLNPEKKDAA